MAIVSKSIFLKGISGSIGKEVVFKKYKNKTVMCKYPDRSKVKPNKWQILNNERFKRATKYAQTVNNDPALRAKYECLERKGLTVFQYVVKERMKEEKEAYWQEQRALTEMIPPEKRIEYAKRLAGQ